MEKWAEWAALTSAAHFPISGRHPAIENGSLRIVSIHECMNERMNDEFKFASCRVRPVYRAHRSALQKCA